MRYNFIHIIKITFILLMLWQSGRVSGQTKIEYTFGSSTSFANGTMSIPTSRNNTNVSFGCSQLDSSSPWLDMGHFAQVNFTNSVSKVVIEFWGADGQDTLRFEVNGVSYPITLAMLSCGWITCSGNSECGTPSITNGNVSNAGPNAYRLTIAPTTAITSFRITNTDGTSGFGLSNFTYTLCPTGVTAPSLSATTKSNFCPATTVDLSSLVSSATPSGSTLKWYTNTSRTTELTNPSATTAGTYYVYYYNTNSNCFSTASAAVTASIAVCCTTQVPDLTN